MPPAPKLRIYITCLKCDAEQEIAETVDLQTRTDEGGPYLYGDILSVGGKYDVARFIQRHVDSTCAALERDVLSIVVR